MGKLNHTNKYWQAIVKVLIVAILYFLLGKFAFSISVSNGIVTNAPFFAEGVGLASTILFGYINAIGVFIGQFVLAITSGVDLSSSIFISLVNSLLAVLGRFLFIRFKVADGFLGFKNILLLSTLILLVIQPVSAILGNLILVESGKVSPDIFLVSSITWWLGNSIGQLVLVPLLLLLFSKPYKLKSLVVRDILIGVLSFLITFLIFKFTYYIDSSYTFLALFFLFPLTLIFAAKGRPETVVLSLLFMTIAAFLGISLNIANLPDISRWDTFMKLDLLIICLQLSGLFITFLLDDRNKVESALRMNEKQLKELNTSKDKLFSIIAHDLKSPFTSIVGYSEILMEHTSNCNQQETVSYAKIINVSSKNTLQMLENLLDWARLHQGRLTYTPRQLNIVEVIRRVIDLLKESSNQKSVTVEFKETTPIFVFADEEMIKIVLRNLLTNAIKFTQSGGMVRILVENINNEMHISVIDNGVGISNENIEKLFNLNANYTTIGTQNEKGTGLGLLLCKEFVEKHNGKIWLNSELGKGSEFTFSLPLESA